MARSLAPDYGIEFRGVVVRTRNPGRTIVDAVIEQGAALIVIGSPEKRRLAVNRQEAFFGRTVDFVLRKAPCRVIVTHFPSEEAVEAAHAVPVTAVARVWLRSRRRGARAPAAAPARCG